ncbi:NirA family protein [Sabulicella rubraurantiaca]|uniref:NirA family protein n=1 Tax=Sabulicella rubraurantiaca TaxID=2811429 RepID=UPI001F43758E|nr:NirA family protein [Sabulicella rubraurantiaca]
MMDGQGFSTEQQNYLKGFMAGVEARRGSLAPSPEGTAPPDALRAAQDRTLAEGRTLVPQEEMKRERHPLDRWDEIAARAEKGSFPKPLEDFAGRYHGLFFVGPAQDAFMCRLRIPGGILSAHQAREVAAIAEECGGGYVDVTTRANLQIRLIPADKAAEVVMRLGEIGLLPRGTGADNIRNITASPTVGIDPLEWVDTRPVVRALHHHILSSRDLFGLPRKFNISIDGGGAVAVLEETNDIALSVVRVPSGELRFRLGLGGITGHKDLARPSDIAVLPGEVVRLCDAILRVFLAHGDRTDRKKARLKYLLDKWGHDRFLSEVEALLGSPLPRFDRFETPPPKDRSAHLGAHPQKERLHWLGVVVPAGRLSADQLRGLAALAPELRLTVWQNVILPHVADVATARGALRALNLTDEANALRAGLVACTGSAGCKFAAADTKGDGQRIAAFLEERISLDAPLNIHLTGCPNSCAQHFIADIGLLGAKVERGEDTLPGYDIHLGGGTAQDAAIGRLIRPKVAAEEVAPLLLNLLRRFLAEREPGEPFQAFCARHDDAALDGMLG